MWLILFYVIKQIKAVGLYAVGFVAIYSYSTQAEVLPTSQITVDADQCRIDFFHLAKNQQQQFEPMIQLAMVYTKNSQSRYVAIKRKIPHNKDASVQYENIQYQRAHKPVAVFTTYWQPLNQEHQIGALVVLGSDNYQQAFDKITSLMFQDNGHFELFPHYGADTKDTSSKDLALQKQIVKNKSSQNTRLVKTSPVSKPRQGTYQFYVQDDHLAQFKKCLP